MPVRALVRCLAAMPVVAALLLVPARPAAAATPPPANDAFADARPISGQRGAAYGTLAGATIEPDCREPRKAYTWYGDRSVWYHWTAPTNGWVRFDLHTYGGWTGYVDAFRWRGHCLSSDSSAYTDTGPGYAELEVTRGEPIWFGVYSEGATNAGPFALSWREIARRAPLNDHFADADTLWGRYGRAYVTNTNATRQTGEPAHAGRTGGRSSWFRWTATHSGPAMFHVAGPTGWDCLLAVYEGASLGTLFTLGSDASTAPGNSCTARFTATAGETYVVALDGERGEEARDALLTWNSGPRPPHDTIGSAKPLAGHEGVLAGTTRGATDEPGEPRDGVTRSGSSVWYRWTAPDDGDASFWVETPAMYEPSSPWEHDKRIAAFTGSPGALTLLAASEPPPADSLGAHFTATEGTTYWLQVSGTDGQAVHYDLIWRLGPDASDEFDEALALPATGSVAVSTRDANAEPGEPGHGLHGYDAKRSLWFQWTAPRTATVTFDDFETPDGFAAKPALSAYTGTSVGALTRVPVTHQYMPGEWNTWSFAATEGTSYRIALDDDSYWRYGDRVRLSWYFGTRDFAGPTVALTEPAEGAVVRGPVTVRTAATDDAGVWSTGFSHDYAATFHTGPHPEPSHDFVFDTERYGDGPLRTTATAWDTRANLATSAERTFVVDNRPPAIRYLGSAEQLTTDTSRLMRWTGDQPLSAAQCGLDGAAFTPCHDYAGQPEGERVYAGLADGVHVFRIRLTDMQGRASPGTYGYWWIVDTAGVGVVPPDDRTAPTATAPVPDLYAGQPVGHTTAPVRLSWTSRDATSGVQRHDVQVSVNGGAWQAMPSYGSLTRTIYQLTGGRTYRFRVRAWDWAGNASGWAYGTRFAVGVAQESAWSLTTSWRRVAQSGASGGYLARTGTKGAVARYAFSGRSVALYGPKAPSLGQFAVYLDGVRVATVNQWDAHGEARAALFVRNRLNPDVRHVLEVRSLGTPGYPGGGTAVAVDVATRVR